MMFRLFGGENAGMVTCLFLLAASYACIYGAYEAGKRGWPVTPKLVGGGYVALVVTVIVLSRGILALLGG